MKTTYDRDRKELKKINLDKLAGLTKHKPPVDTDFILQFGGAELIIQYRLENAGRIGHPFIDIVVGPKDPEMTLDVCDDDGTPAELKWPKGKHRVVQLLLGQVVGEVDYE